MIIWLLGYQGSVSLRQLRLGRQEAQTEEVDEAGEPISVMLPCTEPSEFASDYDSGSLEEFSFAEIKEHVQDEKGNRDCWLPGVYYREAWLPSVWLLGL